MQRFLRAIEEHPVLVHALANLVAASVVLFAAYLAFASSELAFERQQDAQSHALAAGFRAEAIVNISRLEDRILMIEAGTMTPGKCRDTMSVLEFTAANLQRVGEIHPQAAAFIVHGYYELALLNDWLEENGTCDKAESEGDNFLVLERSRRQLAFLKATRMVLASSQETGVDEVLFTDLSQLPPLMEHVEWLQEFARMRNEEHAGTQRTDETQR